MTKRANDTRRAPRKAVASSGSRGGPIDANSRSTGQPSPKTSAPGAPTRRRASGPSGPNIAEAERRTVQRKLRLLPDVDAQLGELAEDEGGASAWVTAIVRREYAARGAS